MSHDLVLKPLGGKIVTKPFLFFSFFAALGMFFLLLRFVFGIGAVSNMSDGYPWGIWIAYDVVVGTALACGGYAMALLIYIFNKGEFHTALRPALMTSVFGYTLAGFGVFFDIGRYWQMYNIFLPAKGHIHSVLFEVALCIASYVLVLWIEFSPAMKHWIKARGFYKILNRILFLIIAIGMLLPTMHQSSLGTLMLITGNKLSPLWHTQLLPLLFLSSAMMMGYAVVIFEAILSSKAYGLPVEWNMLKKLSGIIPWLLLLFLGVRYGDLVYRGKFLQAFQLNYYGFFFTLENLLYLIPLVLLFPNKNRTNLRLLFISAVSAMLAAALYRFNVYLIGYNPGEGWNYFPSFSELSITLGVISLEILGYLIFVKKLPVLAHAKHSS